jgi:hypothetical protein
MTEVHIAGPAGRVADQRTAARALAALADAPAIAASRNLAEQLAQLAPNPATVVSRGLAEQLSRIISNPAAEAGRKLNEQLNDIIRSSVGQPALDALARGIVPLATESLSASFTRALQDAYRWPALDAFERMQASFVEKLNTPSIRELLDRMTTALPANLRHGVDLEMVANVTLDEGIPLAWVPNAELVDELCACSSAEARLTLLVDRRDEVLEDCARVLAGNGDPWATAAREAIDAMRDGHTAPAQSHAANLIDSIVLAIAGERARDKVTERAHADVMVMPYLQAGQALVLRPLARALTKWYADGNTPAPDFFARHVVCHGVGHAGVFSEINALVGVMLASSLVVEFVDVDDEQSTSAA